MSFETYDSQFTLTAFGLDRPPEGASANLGEGLALRFQQEQVDRGFTVSTYLLELVLAIPVHMLADVAAHFLYDWLKSHLKQNTTLKLGNRQIQLDAPNACALIREAIETSPSQDD